MNGLGQTAKRTAAYTKVGRTRSIYEAIQRANGTTIYNMIKSPQNGSSIYEKIRYARRHNLTETQDTTIFQTDWEREPEDKVERR